jgi:hypothetical protein
MLIFTSGTRFPRRPALGAIAPAGLSLGHAFPAGVSNTRSNQFCFNIKVELLLPSIFCFEIEGFKNLIFS